MAKSQLKPIVLWVSEERIPDLGEDSFEFIELQSPELAKKFLISHPVSVLVGSSKLGLEAWKMMAASLGSCRTILMLERGNFHDLTTLINLIPDMDILALPLKTNQLVESLKEALYEAEGIQNLKTLRKKSAAKYRELESLNESLEKIVAERTSHIEVAKLEEDEKLSKVRSLIKFIKDLSVVSAYDEFLEILRREIRKFGKVGDPLLIMSSEVDGLSVYHYHSGHYIRTDGKRSGVSLERGAKSTAQVQSVLANLFGRPMGRIFLMPLEISSWLSQNVSVYLAFENFQLDSSSQKILDFIMERSETMSITIDRLMLEYEHSENAFRWEKTFDSLERPIAIIDSEYEILRANKKFSEASGGLTCYQVFTGQDLPCEGCPLLEALEKSKPTAGTVQIQGRVYQVHSYPILSDGGTANTVVNSYVDITQSRELYLRLLQSEKMGALGVLAGNIAHELNNPLTGLRSLAQVLLKETKPDQTIYSDLVEIEKAAARSQKIIQNLQQFSAHKTTQVELFNLDEVVERTLPMLKTLFRNHRLEVNLETPGALIKGEPSLIQQVIFNLINNACQAMKKPGTLAIETSRIESRQVQLVVSDTGSGIPEAIGTRIFEPFYTTKAEGAGTGLGLSLAKEIVERHGGKIYFTSQLDRGTQFFVTLPINLETTAVE